MSPEYQRTLEQTKSHLQDLFLHDVAVKQELGRAAAALGYGLPAEQFRRPFPGSTQNITIMQNQPQTTAEPSAPAPLEQAAKAVPAAATGFLQSPAGKLLGRTIGATLVGGPIGAGLVYLGTLLGQGSPPAKPTGPPKPIEFELQWKVVDGKFEQKIIPVEPGK